MKAAPARPGASPGSPGERCEQESQASAPGTGPRRAEPLVPSSRACLCPLLFLGSCSGLVGRRETRAGLTPGQTQQQHSLGLLPCSWESVASGSSSSSSSHPALSRLSTRARRQRESGISMPLYWAGTTYCSSLGHRSCREEPGNSPHWHFRSAPRRKGRSAFPRAWCASAQEGTGSGHGGAHGKMS